MKYKVILSETNSTFGVIWDRILTSNWLDANTFEHFKAGFTSITLSSWTREIRIFAVNASIGITAVNATWRNFPTIKASQRNWINHCWLFANGANNLQLSMITSEASGPFLHTSNTLVVQWKMIGRTSDTGLRSCFQIWNKISGAWQANWAIRSYHTVLYCTRYTLKSCWITNQSTAWVVKVMHVTTYSTAWCICQTSDTIGNVTARLAHRNSLH